ncbi:MAG: hypothetical protein KatS3mg129_1892 [Leptospiraceae bacterium]|nr:MAG: hypothetical protein KatS3mg129_1892 [Leptospiraceae bacterium]
MMISNKIIHHPAYYLNIFHRYILIILVLAILQFSWGCLIFYLNYKNNFNLFIIIKKYVNKNFNWFEVYTFIKIYSMYSIVHSLYIILACSMSYFLKSKNWFFSALYFNLFPLIGFLFGFIQIPVSIFYLQKLKTKEWENFFKNYDTFSSMKN